jgi:SAM-dependent methyltransferase
LEYYKQTAFIDLADIYREFRRCIPRGALVLDAGCGVGRDTRYFIKRGYRVVSFDAAREMVKLCRQYPFAYCIRRFFDEITFVEEFDAVWACASLIHLSYPKLKEAIFNLFSAVKPGGIIYFSLKMKNGDEKLSEVVTGRRFYYYSLEEVSEIVEKGLALEPIRIWTNQSRKESDPTEWTNFLYRKPRSAAPIKDF